MLNTSFWLNSVKFQTVASVATIVASAALMPLIPSPAQAGSIVIDGGGVGISIGSPRRVYSRPRYSSPPVYNSPNDIRRRSYNNRSRYVYPRTDSYYYGYPRYGYPYYGYPGGINVQVRKVPRSRINNSTLINPTIIDSEVRNSTIVNPIIIDSDGRTYSAPGNVYIYPNSY
jgi:hypothetical protein